MAGEARRQRLRALLVRAGAETIDPERASAAFVHQSAVREASAAVSNERLEFVGDAVLGLVVGRWLYERYPDAPEGELALRKSSLVSDAALAQTAEALDLEPLLVLGGALRDAAPRRRRSVLADALEAFVAVLWMQAGFETAQAFLVREHIEPHDAATTALDDPKTRLQEWSQKHYARRPQYAMRFEGPDHERTFFAVVEVEGEALAEGSGPSKKLAQRDAASRALETLRERHDDVVPRALSAPASEVKAARPRESAKRKTRGKKQLA